jgi:transcriptional regulator of acetoin/glycerol metabolism
MKFRPDRSEFSSERKRVERQRAVRQGWEAFQCGERPPTGLPLALIESWRRSREFGVDVHFYQAPLAGEGEIFRQRAKNADLLQVARSALDRSSKLFSDAASMMVLADAGGFVIETAGDRRVIEDGRRNHLEMGGRWAESAIGTNAIGTALALGQPMEIQGGEHFCEDVQRWCCSAAPIRHPLHDELLGVVDISGAAKSFNPQNLALAMAIAREIEASLGLQAKLEHETLLRHFVAKRSIWLSDELLVVDRRGFLVHATEQARRKLGDTPDFAHEARKLIGSCGQEEWERNCRQRFPNASVEIVRQDDAALGCLIVLHESRRKSARTLTAMRAATPERSVSFGAIVGESPAIRVARERAGKLAANRLPILIHGETGVGKELFARAILNHAAPPDVPFVPVNCGGMARDLIASELFGYVRGAFTGADENGCVGKIQQADGGMLCLDEIGEMPLDLQSYLLRVLEDGVVYRIGGHQGAAVNFQLISMTNRDLATEVEAGRFRRDLYYRLAAAGVRIPPLRERGDDVSLLAKHFAARAAEKRGIAKSFFTKAALAALAAYDWPGNVRELRNVVDTMIALSDGRECLGVDDLPPEIVSARHASVAVPATTTAVVASHGAANLKQAERAAILAQVEACGGNLTKAAKHLGIARSTLYVRLGEYGAAARPNAGARSL